MKQLILNNSPDANIIRLFLEYHKFSDIKITKEPTLQTPTLETEHGKLSGTFTILRFLNRLVQDKSLIVRSNDVETSQVYQWVGFCQEQLSVNPKELLPFLNSVIENSTYFVGTSLSLADLYLYAYLHQINDGIENLQKKEYVSLCRWFDFIQHHEPWGDNEVGSLKKVAFDESKIIEKFVFVPEQKEEKKKDDKKEKEDKKKDKDEKKKEKDEKKKEKEEKEAKKKEEKKKEKEEKKKAKEEKKKSKEKKEGKQSGTSISICDIRVGKILSVRIHENADSMYVEEIDVGEEKPRTICSGLRGKVQLEDMKDQVVLVLCNLKPKNARGITSNGMLLAATGKDGKVELLKVPSGYKIGERVVFEGHEGEPASPSAMSKKLDKILDDLVTDENGIVSFKGGKCKCSGGYVTSNLKGAAVK